MNQNEQERRARWLAGDLEPDERKRFEAEAVEDADLVESLYADVVLDESLRETARSKVVTAPRRRRPNPWLVGASAIAAAVALIVLRVAFFPPTDGDSPVMRSGEDAKVTLVEPTGERQFFPRRFVWRPVEGASSYRWELYDAQTRRRGVEVVSDTLLARDTSQTPVDSTGTWRWLVVAIMANGAEGPSSRSATFTVVSPDDPADQDR